MPVYPPILGPHDVSQYGIGTKPVPHARHTIRLNIGHHCSVCNDDQINFSHIEIVQAHVNSTQVAVGQTEKPSDQATAMIMVEADTDECVARLAYNVTHHIVPRAFTAGSKLQHVTSAVGYLVDQQQDDNPHVSIVLIQWPICRIIHAGENRHVLLRRSKAHVLESTRTGSAEFLSTSLVHNDWVVVMGYRTSDFIPLGITGVLAQRSSTPTQLCNALIDRADQSESDHAYAVMALHVQED